MFLRRNQKSSVRPSEKPKTPYHFKWIKCNEEEHKGKHRENKGEWFGMMYLLGAIWRL